MKRLRPPMPEGQTSNTLQNQQHQSTRPNEPQCTNPAQRNTNQPNDNTPFKEEEQHHHQQSQQNNQHAQLHKRTSQAHKIPPENYKINPKQIPRPTNADEIYFNTDRNPIFETSVGSVPPYSTSYFSVKETMNTSCRFVRSTLNYIPTDQSLLNQTNLLFGLSVQPFTEVPEYEEQIPKIEANDNIFRCKNCKSYINNKYNITYSGSKQVAICNICATENEFDINKPGMKNEYFNSDVSGVPELSIPTVDFIAPTKFNTGLKDFKPHYIFMIDISRASYDLGWPSYVINSIQTNLDFFNNMEETWISINLYDTKAWYFFYIEKNEVKVSIVPDVVDPYCPIGIKKWFLNISKQRTEIEKLIERWNSYINDANSDNTLAKVQSTPTGAAIKSGVDALFDNGGRVMIFTPNHCASGFAACVERSKFDKIKEPEKWNIFYPQHEILTQLAETAVNNRIVVDQFIFMSQLYDLATMSTVSNLTGGHVEYYQYSQDPQIINSCFEKMHYDLTRILTRQNYYDVKFMIRFSLGVDCVEILGPFNKKLGEAFQLGGCDPDYSFFYNLRLNETFKPNTKLHFQIVSLFIDNYNQRYLRIFNSTYETANAVGKIFNSSDVDALTKAIIMKEISLTYRSDFERVRENLEDRIINSIKYYRMIEKVGTPSGQWILPVTLRYLPWYIDSFLKKGIWTKNKIQTKSTNYIIHLTYKLMRDPVYSMIRFLYPKFYRIDDIQSETYQEQSEVIRNIGLTNEKYNIIQKPVLIYLSKDNIDFDSAYWIDDGLYINLFIFDQINQEFYVEMFNMNSFEEVVAKEIVSWNEENDNDLNWRVLNIISQLRKENSGHYQPIRLFLFRKNDIARQELAQLLIEDKYGEEVNYSDFWCHWHNQIQLRLAK